MGNFLKNTLVGFVLGGLSLTLTNCSYEKIKADGSEFKYDNTLQKFAWEIKETKEALERKKSIIIKAKEFVESARKKGIKDKQVKDLFRKKGWKEEDINKIF